ncbi:MAG: hypothetical protein A2W75_04025 [Nitrospinae bacterium RIFCSPLOWO2_12_39_15]|nr:MAG: hypothetical protein A2W75_04025 [Nitrospinae bacterium RIFCSPLOWO2_12_39_15]
MARRYRVESSDKKVLESLARERGGQIDIDTLLDEIESTGNLSPETRAKLATKPSKGILPLLEQIIGSLPSKRQAYEQFLGQTDIGKEPELTDEELQERLNLYGELGGIKETGLDEQKLYNFLLDKFKKSYKTDKGNEKDIPLAERNARFVLEYLKNNKRLPEPSQLERGAIPLNIDVINPLREGNIYGEFLKTSPETGEDVKRIQDIVSGRGLKRQREEELSQFESGLESELGRGREEFLAGEQEYGGRYFQEQIAPKIAENLNVRGLLYSGDLQSELARSAAGIQSGTEQEYLRLQEEDDLFFQNAAYQTTFKKEIEAGRGISESLASERGTALERQQISFGRTQADLRRRYEEESYRRDLERQSRIQESRLRSERDYGRQQQQDKFFNDIGSTVGTIAGTYIGSKYGQPTVSSKGVV